MNLQTLDSSSCTASMGNFINSRPSFETENDCIKACQDDIHNFIFVPEIFKTKSFFHAIQFTFVKSMYFTFKNIKTLDPHVRKYLIEIWKTRCSTFESAIKTIPCLPEYSTNTNTRETIEQFLDQIFVKDMQIPDEMSKDAKETVLYYLTYVLKLIKDKQIQVPLSLFLNTPMTHDQFLLVAKHYDLVATVIKSRPLEFQVQQKSIDDAKISIAAAVAVGVANTISSKILGQNGQNSPSKEQLNHPQSKAQDIIVDSKTLIDSVLDNKTLNDPKHTTISPITDEKYPVPVIEPSKDIQPIPDSKNAKNIDNKLNEQYTITSILERKNFKFDMIFNENKRFVSTLKWPSNDFHALDTRFFTLNTLNHLSRLNETKKIIITQEFTNTFKITGISPTYDTLVSFDDYFLSFSSVDGCNKTEDFKNFTSQKNKNSQLTYADFCIQSEPNFNTKSNNLDSLEVSGRQFNQLVKKFNYNLVRLTTFDENHNGFQFRTGLNIDIKPFCPDFSCAPGGLYFIDSKFISQWTSYNDKSMHWRRSVTIPDDARVYIQHSLVYDCSKFKADRIILGEREPINILV